MIPLYMAVTADDKELPIAVSNNAKELGKMVGLEKSRILQAISKKLKCTILDNGQRVKFIKIEVDKDG